MTDEIKLRDCPYCGYSLWEETNDGCAFRCKSCGAISPNIKNVAGGESAVDLANTRPLEDKLTAENAKLRALVGELAKTGDRLASMVESWGAVMHIENYGSTDMDNWRSLMSKVKEVLGENTTKTQVNLSRKKLMEICSSDTDINYLGGINGG